MKRLFFVSMVAASVLPLAACFNDSGSSGNGTTAGNPEVVPPLVEAQATRFRVLPYLQNPSATGTTVVWFTDTDVAGSIEVEGIGSFDSRPVLAEHLSYGASEVDYIHGDKNYGNTLPIHGHSTWGWRRLHLRI